MTKEELEQKADRFCKDYNFTYTILSYNQTKRKSGALIAKESYIAGYHQCEKDTIHTDNKETLQNALKRIEELEAQIEKMKQELDTAREEANRQEQWELYSVLNGIYNDNFEVITSVSN